jgi:succinyl-CoA:acetate CoA-transferase
MATPTEPGAVADRVRLRALANKMMSADEAAALIQSGSTIGMSGFTGAGYPKAVPAALVRRLAAAHGNGRPFTVTVCTGVAMAPELDSLLAATDGITLRMSYQSDPVMRAQINAGEADYQDVHLSYVAQLAWEGFLGNLDFALVEVAGITDDGGLIPSSSVGNNKTWLDLADRVILEVNSWLPIELEGMHDIYYGAALPPDRTPIPLTSPADRIGEPYLRCDPEKIVAIVPTHAPDRNTGFNPPDGETAQIAGHVLEFLAHEVKRGRLPRTLLPLQSGVGNIANAVLLALDAGEFDSLTAYTEVIQDGMLQMLGSGTLRFASGTSLSLSEAGIEELRANIADYRKRIVLRPMEISNHPEIVRRLGCLAMNTMLEADMYGNVNSTHVMGSRIHAGVGGSGDFTRNAYVSMFLSPSVAKGGAISCIVPMASHVDHTEHDVKVIVTEQGLADLRGLPPRRRAQLIIDRCAHPDYRDQLQDYLDRALAGAPGKQTPHKLDEALSWHTRYLSRGTMRS